MIMVNHDKGFAEMLPRPAFRKSPPTADRTPTRGYAATRDAAMAAFAKSWRRQ